MGWLCICQDDTYSEGIRKEGPIELMSVSLSNVKGLVYRRG